MFFVKDAILLRIIRESLQGISEGFFFSIVTNVYGCKRYKNIFLSALHLQQIDTPLQKINASQSK